MKTPGRFAPLQIVLALAVFATSGHSSVQTRNEELFRELRHVHSLTDAEVAAL
jgi:hypothetical protein